LDFIQQCLEWDPSKRMNPEKAFQHEWILQSSRPTATVRHSPTDNNDEQESGHQSPKPTSII
jgi:serine/threonine protein kinase